MSFKIFLLQLTGKIIPVEKVEAQRTLLEKNYRLFLDAEKSSELSEFRELESWVKSGAMAKAKQELEQQIFKGSPEGNQEKEYETLRKKKSIRNFFHIAGSQDLKRFEKIRESAELREFYSLKDYVEGGAYQQEKKEIEIHRFAGSAEEKHLTELAGLKRNKAFNDFLRLDGSDVLKKHQRFVESPVLRRFLELKNLDSMDKHARQELRKLSHDASVKEYFRFEKSRMLKHYYEVAGTNLPDRFRHLTGITGTSEFQKRVEYLRDNQKLQKSEAWKKYQRFKSLSEKEDIRFFLKFEKSPLYLNYLDVRDSFDLHRYKELKAMVESPEFQKRKAWLEDKKKWEKTDAYKRFEKYSALQKHPHISLYFKYVNSRDFDFLRNWQRSFDEPFEGKALDLSRWTANSHWADKLGAGNFSQPGDLQAFTGGKNCQVSGNRLKIVVKKEKYGSKRWVPFVGFMQEEFGYTSDTISTCNSFWQEGGIFEARLQFRPMKHVVSSCYLTGKNNSPMIILMEQGPEPRMGILSADHNGKQQFSGISLKHLSNGKDYIFGLEWTDSSLVWKINSTPVFETRMHLSPGEAHVNLTSLVLEDIPAGSLPVGFESGWIRCYRKV